MQTSSEISSGIIKRMPTDISLQICKLHSGEYCITATENSSDATRTNHILLRINKDELNHIIRAFQAIQDAP